MPRSGSWLSSGNNCTGMDLRLSGSTVLSVPRVRGLLTVCVVESTAVAGVVAVWLLSCPSGCAPAVSGLPTVYPIVDPASDPSTYPDTVATANYPCRLLFRLCFRLLSTVTFSTVWVLAVNPSRLHVYLIKWWVSSTLTAGLVQSYSAPLNQQLVPFGVRAP